MTVKNASAKEETVSISSKDLVKALRSEITLGRLRPRERLVEEELCERYQVKRYALRNALDTLEKIGLVIRRPNRGVVVNDLTIEELDQLYQMRKILHREAIALIPQDALADLAETLETIQLEFTQCLVKRDFDGLPAADSAFHGKLYKACGNQYLSSAIDLHWQKTLCIHSFAYGNSELSQQSADEHDQIIAAVRTGDRKRLAILCNDHMLLSLQAYRNTRGRW